VILKIKTLTSVTKSRGEVMRALADEVENETSVDGGGDVVLVGGVRHANRKLKPAKCYCRIPTNERG
jgi:hypothetical protein